MITADARSLATAVLADDETAADALLDWAIENRRHPPFDLRGYVDRLEDALRECRQLVMQSPVPSPVETWTTKATRVVVARSLTKKHVDRIYTLCFNLEREAKLYGRMGPA